MSILSVSVSHKTTSVDLLSRLAMDSATAGKLGQALLDSDHIDEAIVLSTCNRTELYASVSRFHGGLDDATTQLAELAGWSVPELQHSCAVYFDEGAVAHLFAVAAGLDSLVVGESQILGQVKHALAAAQSSGTVGTVLNALFQQALRVGKRVQSETDIGHAGRSLVSLGVRPADGGDRPADRPPGARGRSRGDGGSGSPDGCRRSGPRSPASTAPSSAPSGSPTSWVATPCRSPSCRRRSAGPRCWSPAPAPGICSSAATCSPGPGSAASWIWRCPRTSLPTSSISVSPWSISTGWYANAGSGADLGAESGEVAAATDLVDSEVERLPRRCAGPRRWRRPSSPCARWRPRWWPPS